MEEEKPVESVTREEMDCPVPYSVQYSDALLSKSCKSILDSLDTSIEKKMNLFLK